MGAAILESVFESVELRGNKDPRDAQTSGGMTELSKEFDVITVPVRPHPALEVSGGAA